MSSSGNRTSTPKSDLERIAWPRLDEAFLEELFRHAERRRFEAGDVLFEVGAAAYDFVYVETGSVDIVDRASGSVVLRIDQGNFVGELGMLMGQGTFFAGVAGAAVQARVVPAPVLRDLVARVPVIGDVVVPAFIARRRLLLEWREGGLVVSGPLQDRRTVRLLAFLERGRIPHRWVEPGALPAEHVRGGDGPVVVLGASVVLDDPSPHQLARALGLDLAADADGIFDVLVVGAGPAGLAASVYAASEGLSVLAVEDTAIGGQAGTSSRIENYLGFPTGVSGAELAHRGAVQAFKFGARITVPRRATGLKCRDGEFQLALDDERCVRGRSVVLATGLQYRRLPIDGLGTYEGQGVYYAATDLEARFCTGREAVVIGGGNSAGQAAMFLSRYASRVHIVVRGPGLSATMSSYLSRRIERDERVELHTHSEVVAVHGDGSMLSRVTMRDGSGSVTDLEASALFVMIGARASTDWLEGLVERDDYGLIHTGPGIREGAGEYDTSLPGVFAVGDVRAGSVKRVASAVGEGSVVVSSIHRYLQRTE